MAVSNEEIVTALMNYSTIEAAADSVGLSRRAVYSRMKGKGFRLLYMQAREATLQGAAAALQAHVTDAVETAAEIMKDKQNPAGVRLQAAGMILSQADRFTNRVSMIHREAGRALTTASGMADLTVGETDEDYD